MAQLAQLGVAGGLSDIVGSDKDPEEEDSEEDVEEDGEGDQIMAKVYRVFVFFCTMVYKTERSVEMGTCLLYVARTHHFLGYNLHNAVKLKWTLEMGCI